MNKFEETKRLIIKIRKETDTAVLFYSAGGKDGLVLLDLLAKSFKRVICYYMWLIPELDHIRPYIRWAEHHYKNVEVRQIQHYQRDYFDFHGVWQIGDGNHNIVPRNVGDVEEFVRKETGIKWAFSGMKGVDGYMKRMRLLTFKKRNGDYFTEAGMVYPLAMWTNKEVLRYIERYNLIKPFVYDPNGVSQGFNIDLRCLLILRKLFPNDYKKMIAEFPLCEMLVHNYDKFGTVPKGHEKEIAGIEERLRKLGGL